MTQPETEPRSTGPLANTLTTKPFNCVEANAVLMFKQISSNSFKNKLF